MAGAAALVAGLMAKGMTASTPVATADGNFIVIGAADNSGTVVTARSSNNTTDTLRIINFGSGAGLHGLAGNGIGVFGESTTGPGVRGTSGAGGTEDGVRGLAFGTGRGISGFAGSGVGAQGNAATGKGVEGLATTGIAVNGQSTTGPGVRGTTAAGSTDDGGRFLADKGRGVAGFTNSGIGVQGNATTGYAVVGVAPAGAAAALYGSSSGVNTPAFAAYNGMPGGLAGTFNGQVFINGNYTATGTKSAAVPHPDGTHRLLYCVESPEAWFEDFGTGTITGGKAEVKLDPDFAAVVDTAKLHVFTESHDEHHALHIAGTSTTGFTVGVVPSTTGAAAGKKASDLNGTFTYRVVAKRKDVAAPRLAKYDLPKIIPPPPVFATSDTPATPKK